MTNDQPNEGLGLTYSQVVDVVYQLCQQGQVQAPIEVVVSPLAKQIADYEKSNDKQERPETRPDTLGTDDLGQDEPGLAPVPRTRPDTAYPADNPPQASSR